MRKLLHLAWHSALNRRYTLALTIFTIALSTFLMLGVERIRADVRSNFTSAVSGTDLIVGARGGSVELLLYSVFHLGSPSNNIRWRSVQELAAQPAVAWVAPLSLGDSHRGFPVLGTTAEYLRHFQYGDQQHLHVAQGAWFSDLFDAVLGADVAQQLGYAQGQKITLAHGTGEVLTHAHDHMPFTVSGILARTGTPVDRTVHISLEAMQALHVDWMAGGAPMPASAHTSADKVRTLDLTPRSVTAALVGLKNRAAVFSVQQYVNRFSQEPLMAVLPGVALDELWQLIGMGERALRIMSLLVALVSIAGLVSVMQASLNERRRELAVLRAVGATPWHIMSLLALEGALLTLLGILLGAVLFAGAGIALNPWLQGHYGLSLHVLRPTAMQGVLLGGLLTAGCLSSLLPGWWAYRMSLSDGLSPKT